MALRNWILRVLPRLLPPEFRERVLEPALADLEHEERSSHVRRSRQWLARTILIAECLRLGVPQFVWRRGRPTRFGLSVVAVILLLVWLIQRSRYVAA
jgi:hypothetical protein